MLAVSTANAATLFAAGLPITETVGANVVALTREVLMSMTRVKLYTAGALCALALGAFLPLVTAQETRPEPKVRGTNYLKAWHGVRG
jgi:hypothetical protein